MEVTRRFWGSVGIALALGMWGLFLQRVVLLIGTAVLGAWLLTAQYRFVRDARKTVERLDIRQEIEDRTFIAGETITGTLDVRGDIPTGLTVQITAESPLAENPTIAKCEVSAGNERAKTEFQIVWPTAGQFAIGNADMKVQDKLGLFSQAITDGTVSTVTVEPRTPSNIHIGEGGDRIEFGEFASGLVGSGLTPDEVRKYVPGDNTNRIDWKATARLNDAYVREFETETNLETVLIFDHRAAMQTGQESQRKIDLAREVALAIVGDAESLGERFSWYAVGNEGLTESWGPTTNPKRYKSIAQRLQALDPTETVSGQSTPATADPSHARQIAAQLNADTEFDRKLNPFFDSETKYVQRIKNEPLFGAIRAAKTNLDKDIRAIIVSDDSNQVEIREAVKAASSGRGQVVVFLTPTVLYQTATVVDIETAYRQYTEFESFRRELASFPGVNAYEVGPRDRLDAILASAERQQRVKQ
jgi:uncharacterized protein (DUF58 family)